MTGTALPSDRGAATHVAADKLKGPGADFGRIAVGAHADLPVLAEDPRLETGVLARPEFMIAAGRPVELSQMGQA